MVEWTLRRVAAAEADVELRPGVQVAALLTTQLGRATGVKLGDGDVVPGT
jgi:hypothetical protein